MIQLKNITKSYPLSNGQRHYVFKDLNFTFPDECSIGLMGRNGAGKSTLLKLMTGVIYPTKGKIHINGKVSALLELTAGFDLEFTGRENIYFRGQLLGMKNNEIAALEDEIVSFAELGDFLYQPVKKYSDCLLMPHRTGGDECL